MGFLFGVSAFPSFKEGKRPAPCQETLPLGLQVSERLTCTLALVARIESFIVFFSSFEIVSINILFTITIIGHINLSFIFIDKHIRSLLFCKYEVTP